MNKRPAGRTDTDTRRLAGCLIKHTINANEAKRDLLCVCDSIAICRGRKAEKKETVWHSAICERMTQKQKKTGNLIPPFTHTGFDYGAGFKGIYI